MVQVRKKNPLRTGRSIMGATATTLFLRCISRRSIYVSFKCVQDVGFYFLRRYVSLLTIIFYWNQFSLLSQYRLCAAGLGLGTAYSLKYKKGLVPMIAAGAVGTTADMVRQLLRTN